MVSLQSPETGFKKCKKISRSMLRCKNSTMLVNWFQFYSCKTLLMDVSFPFVCLLFLVTGTIQKKKIQDNLLSINNESYITTKHTSGLTKRTKRLCIVSLLPWFNKVYHKQWMPFYLFQTKCKHLKLVLLSNCVEKCALSDVQYQRHISLPVLRILSERKINY